MTRLYPLEPLAEAMGCTLSEVGRRLGVSGTTWKQYRDQGVSELVADRLATRAGLHPAVVWPEWMDDQIDEVGRECWCGTRFVPKRSHQRHCSPTCRDRARNAQKAQYRRSRYQTDPEWAEAQRARRRAYYAECGDYERARQRRYDTAKRQGRAA